MLLEAKFVLLISLIIGVVFLAIYIGNNMIQITKYTLELDKEALKGDSVIRVVHLSDLQCKSFGRNNERLIKVVSGLTPDIVIFSGDLLDRRADDFFPAYSLMEGISSFAKVFYVHGNHELCFSDKRVKEFNDTLASMGVSLLENKVDELNIKGVPISIIGLDERLVMIPGKNRRKVREDVNLARLEEVVLRLQSGAKGKIKLLISHEPQFLPEYAQNGIDFIFSGHAHGGQIRIPLLGGLFAPGQGKLPKLTSGIHMYNDSRMVISRGLGNSVFPIRFCNRPEVIMLQLKGK